MESVWEKSCSFEKREELNGSIVADVAVVGGGIAGLLTAYELQKEGLKVVVLEAKNICSGNTENTTAKITSQHDLIYDYLIKEFGAEKASQYARANEEAIKRYKDIITKNAIDCDFEEIPTYIYSIEDKEAIEREVAAARQLGISADLVEALELPFEVAAAVRFNNQGQFNPLKFLKFISRDLVIYENSKAIEIKKNLVKTEYGEVIAKDIVIATHYPIINTPGYYFMRMHQERSYVIALENAQQLKGAYKGSDKFQYSFRSYKDLLLLGGAGHRTGEADTSEGYNELRSLAKKLYPKGREKYHWSAQDCMSMDKVPYIGQYSVDTPNTYVITGFEKWGMTTAMVAAQIITDAICGRKNKNEEIFSPRRFDVTASMKTLAEDGVASAKGLIKSMLHIPTEQLKDINRNQGAIVDYEGEKVGVYKDSEGKCHIVSVKCPHLGCELQWNNHDLSWDCPCHGSRFDYKGSWIESPAIVGVSYE